MSAFIVSGGSLLEIGCPSALSRETEQQVSFTRTLGGKRKGFARRGGRRAWSVDASVARPGEVSTLEAVARGIGPYGWYPPEATVGNLLSPQAVDWSPLPAGTTDAGLTQLPDGSIARSVVHTSTSAVSVGDFHGGYEAVPVRRGHPVAVGVWALGGVQFSGWWLDASLARLHQWTLPRRETRGWSRVQSAFTPPAEAAFVTLQLDGGVRYARPSVSWGETAHDHGGMGCPGAVVHTPAFTPLALWGDANYTNSSYQVTEVG